MVSDTAVSSKFDKKEILNVSPLLQKEENLLGEVLAERKNHEPKLTQVFFGSSAVGIFLLLFAVILFNGSASGWFYGVFAFIMSMTLPSVVGFHYFFSNLEKKKMMKLNFLQEKEKPICE